MIMFTLEIPYDRPDSNGHVFTKSSILNAISNLKSRIPIIFKNKEGEDTVIGVEDGLTYISSIDEKTKTIYIHVSGNFLNPFNTGSFEFLIKKSNGRNIEKFDITSLYMNEYKNFSF